MRGIHGSLSNKMRDGTTMSSKEINIELKASELQDQDLKELRQYEMTREKYEASQNAMNVYQR